VASDRKKVTIKTEQQKSMAGSFPAIDDINQAKCIFNLEED
jgi:hypothetical protein